MTLTDGGDAAAGAALDTDAHARVLSAAVRCFRERAFHEVTLEAVAAAGGLEVQDVTASYPTLNELVIVTVRAWVDRRTEPLLPIAQRSGAVAFVRAMMVANLADPALMRLLSAMVNVAGTPGHVLAPLLQQQWVQFHAHVQRTLATDVEIGREPASTSPVDGAEQLIALYEGLQLQSMLRPNMNVIASFDRAVARLRDGWSAAGVSTSWDV